MACCLFLSQVSKTWLALLVPVLAVSVRFSVTYSVLLILFSTTFFLFTFSKPKPILVDNSLLNEDEDKLPHKENHQSTPVQEHALISSPDCSDEDVRKVLSAQAKTDTISQKKTQFEDNGQGFLIRSHDLYSESESMDQYSSSSSEYHSSDIEWPYNMGQRLDCSDDSISDEESLIEIAIPTGQFVSPEKDLKLNLKCCKLSKDFSDDQETIFEKDNFLADYINEMNEEDNLIEIDIYMGSIKYSSFDS